MAGLFVKTNTGETSSSWSQVKSIWVKTDPNTWTPVVAAFVKTIVGETSASWSKFFGSTFKISSPVTITTNTSNALISLTGTNYVWTPSPSSLNYTFTWYNGSVTQTIDGPTTIPNGSSSGTSYTYGPISAGTDGSPAGLISQNLTPNVINTYSFTVTAPDGTNSTASVSIQGPTDVTLSAPSSNTASSCVLSWTASTGANRYLVYASTDNSNFYLWGQTANTSVTFQGTLNGSPINLGTNMYYFYVTPVTGSTSSHLGYYGNNSNTTNTSIATQPPNSPTLGIDSANTTYTNIRFTFYSVVDSTHDAASSYYYSADSGIYTKATSYDSTNNWYYVDLTVPASAAPTPTHTISVYAANASGSSSIVSENGNAAAVTPPSSPPTNISVSSSGTNLTVTANAGGNTNGMLLNYGSNTNYGLGSNIPFTNISGNSYSVTVTGLAPSDKYYFQIVPTNYGVQGNSSTYATGNTILPPYDPTFSLLQNGYSNLQDSFFISSIGATQINVSVYKANNGTGTSGYGYSSSYGLYDSFTINGQVGYYYIPSNGYYYLTATSTNASSFSNPGGLQYSNYAVGIGQDNITGNYGANGTTANWAYAGTPNTPVSPTASQDSTILNQADISWSAYTADSGAKYINNVASYEIYLSTSSSTPGVSTSATEVNITNTSYNIIQGYNTTYYYWVRSRNTNAASAWVYAGSVSIPKGNIGTSPTYGSSTSVSGGWSATVNNTPSPSGGTYSIGSANNGSISINSSTGAVTASGLSSGQSSSATVTYAVNNYNSVSLLVFGSAKTVTVPTVKTSPSLSGSGVAGTSLTATAGTYNYGSVTNTAITYSTASTAHTAGVSTTASSATHSSPYTVTTSDGTAPVDYFWAVDTISGTDGNTYYGYSSSVASSLPVTYTPNVPSYTASSSGTSTASTKLTFSVNITPPTTDSTHSAATSYTMYIQCGVSQSSFSNQTPVISTSGSGSGTSTSPFVTTSTTINGYFEVTGGYTWVRAYVKASNSGGTSAYGSGAVG
jgi:hypothetical protein